MKIRKHSFTGVGDRCIYCGAKKMTGDDQRTCLERDDSTADRPEPKRRLMAIDDVETISSRIKELRNAPV